MEKEQILIVGGTGFIGYHLAKKLIKEGLTVTSISTKPPKRLRYLSNVRYIICDISNKNSLKKKVNKYYKYIVNLGGYVDHSNNKKTLETHYDGCKNLAEFFKKKPPSSFIQMGSSVEYGNAKSPQKEDMKCDLSSNKSTYGKAKLSSSRYLINLYKRDNFPSIILRLYLSYGPKQDINRLIPYVIMSCLKNIKFDCSLGTQVRDFVHVDDVVNAIFKLLKNKKAIGQIYNLGSGKQIKIKEVIEKIKNISKGGHPRYGKIKLRKDEIKKLYPNISKIKKVINWKPKILFEKGLKSTIKSYKNLL